MPDRKTASAHHVNVLGVQNTGALQHGAPRYDASTLTIRLDQAWRILNLNQDLIRSADQKIYLLIVMSTLLVTYVSANLDKIMHLGVREKSCLILFLIAGAGFFYFALTTLLARARNINNTVAKNRQSNLQGNLQSNPQENPQNHAQISAGSSLIFFGDIAHRHSAGDYAAAFHQADLHDVLDDVCHQIHQVAAIATTKYAAYRRAWLALVIEVSLFLVLEFSIIL